MSQALAKGEVFAGRYEVRGPSGEGPGYVGYRVYDRQLKTELDLWRMREGLFPTESERDAFVGSVVDVRALKHPHLRRLYDAGRDGDTVYVTTQRSEDEGRLLRAGVHRRASELELLRVASALAQGLAVAHEHGHLHCWMTPVDVVSVGGEICVGGVGIYRDLNLDAARAAWSEFSDFVAPEVRDRGAVSPAADVYSMAAVLIRLAAPGDDADLDTLGARLRESQPGLARVLLRGLAASPTGRPASPSQLLVAIRARLIDDRVPTAEQPAVVPPEEDVLMPRPMPEFDDSDAPTIPETDLREVLGEEALAKAEEEAAADDEQEEAGSVEEEEESADREPDAADTERSPPLPEQAMFAARQERLDSDGDTAPYPPTAELIAAREAAIAELSGRVRVARTEVSPSRLGGETEPLSDTESTELDNPASRPTRPRKPVTADPAEPLLDRERLLETEPATLPPLKLPGRAKSAAEGGSKGVVYDDLAVADTESPDAGAATDPGTGGGTLVPWLFALTFVLAAGAGAWILFGGAGGGDDEQRTTEEGTSVATGERDAGGVGGMKTAPADGGEAVASDGGAAGDAPPSADAGAPVGSDAAVPHGGCPEGMRLIANGRVCMEQYEYPGRGQMPVVGMTREQAATECAKRERRLCALAEWLDACRGSEDTSFPYGNAYRAGRCNVRPGDTGAVREGGAFPDCVGEAGVHDLSGNVSEWVSDTETAHGGSARDATEGRCSARRRARRLDDVGFRCCVDVAVDTE